MHEWPLLIFTLSLQIAIGGMLMLAVFYRSLAKGGAEEAFKLLKLPLLVIVLLSIVGLAASFAHLGTPSHAFNMIGNLGSSWMSREILFTGLFIAAACITVGLAFTQKKVNPWLLGISAIIGLIDVYCMAAIYGNTLVSGWGAANTFTSFYGTVIVLGPVLAVCLIAPKLSNAQGIIKIGFVTAILGVAIQIIGIALFTGSASEINMVAGNSAMSALDGYQNTVMFRWVIEATGLGIIGYLALASVKKASYSFAYLALAAIVVAEGMSRYVFYVLGA